MCVYRELVLVPGKASSLYLYIIVVIIGLRLVFVELVYVGVVRNHVLVGFFHLLRLVFRFLFFDSLSLSLFLLKYVAKLVLNNRIFKHSLKFKILKFRVFFR
jgi:hypothetical protein